MKNNEIVLKAVKVLKQGGVVVLPTATVYGLAVEAQNQRAVKKIYKIKGRSEKKPLVLMLAYKKQLGQLPIFISKSQENLIWKIWPKPVTFIVKTTKKFAGLFYSQNETIALRLADHPLTKKIIAGFGGFLATTSANYSGSAAAGCLEEIPKTLLKKADLVIDGGHTIFQKPSTIIDLTAETPKILRQGAYEISGKL